MLHQGSRDLGQAEAQPILVLPFFLAIFSFPGLYILLALLPPVERLAEHLRNNLDDAADLLHTENVGACLLQAGGAAIRAGLQGIYVDLSGVKLGEDALHKLLAEISQDR